MLGLSSYGHARPLVPWNILLAATVISFAPNAFAQEQDDAAETTFLEAVVVKSSRQAQEEDVYTAPKSSVYIPRETIERFATVSPGDVLKGQPGVQVGDTRNGGALDVNIRGIQGQNRVGVIIDGAQQSISAYRGYAGTQMRSYIDPDMLGGIVINKGPSLTPNASGSIGGTVEMHTISAADILKDGSTFGLLTRGDLGNNSVKPPEGNSSAQPRDSMSYALRDLAKSGSAAVAYRDDSLELVGAYARRFQGNYLAGTHGRDRYLGTGPTGLPDYTVASVYKEGEEVMNTSRDTESALLKAKLFLTDEQVLELGYRSFYGLQGEVMPSVILRGNGKHQPLDHIDQWPLGKIGIDTYTARYTYDPADNDLVNITANAWVSDTDSESLNASSAYAPESQVEDIINNPYTYAWRRQHNLRWGGDIANRSEFDTTLGGLAVDIGASFQSEMIEPAKGVVITEQDRLNNRIVTDGDRQEASLVAQAEYEPTDYLSFRAGGRFTTYRTQDNNRYSIRTAWGGDLPDGPVYEPAVERQDSGFAPSYGVTLKPTDDTLLYANYSEGLRAPSLFESIMGTDALLPDVGLRPERARAFEIGASQTFSDVFEGGDEADLKLAYFHTSIKDQIARLYNPDFFNVQDFKDYDMRFYNADSFTVSGLEFQSRYDSGRLFGDLSATYYFGAQTCDKEIAGFLRSVHNPAYGINTANTPDCTAGGFSGSFTNTQNPPKLSVNLTAGARLFDEKLTVGGRMTYTSGPTERLNKESNGVTTTLQVYYAPVAVFDLFASYKLNDSAVIQASVQNLTDQYYLDPLAQSYMPAPGRTFRLALSAKF